MKENSEIAIVMGSKNDLPNLKGAFKILNEFNIEFSVQVISAHRTPAVALDFAQNAEKNGIKVIIGVAGMAAHLSGVIASHTILPVIGLPMACPPFDGLDALLATVQMPPGIPVASVTVGSAGAKNAALFAISILALSNSDIAKKLKAFRSKQTEVVLAANNNLKDEVDKLISE